MLCVLALACAAAASPIFGIGEGRPISWTEAITTGLVRPLGAADPIDGAAAAYYGALAASLGLAGFARVDTILTPDVTVSDPFGETHLSLVKSYDHLADPTLLEVAEWEFAYIDDPDLTGTLVRFQNLDPRGVLGMGIQLIDEQGRARGWFRTQPDPVWDGSYAFDPTVGLQGPFTFFFNEPAFDIQTVLQIRMSNGSNQNFPFVEPDPTGHGEAWDATAYLEVVPEPSTLLVLLPGLLLLRRRQVRQK